MNYQLVALNASQEKRAHEFAGRFTNPSTQESYRIDAAQFIHWVENEEGKSFEGLTAPRAQRWMGKYAARLSGLSRASRIRKTNVARYYLATLGVEVCKPAIPQEEPPILWVPFETAARIIGSDRITPRQRLVVALCALEGFTPTEIISLTVDDGTLPFKEPQTWEILAAWLAVRGVHKGPLFCQRAYPRRRLSRVWAWKEVSNAGAALNVKNCNPMSLRVSCILRLSYFGASTEVIANRLGTDPSNITRTLKRVKKK